MMKDLKLIIYAAIFAASLIFSSFILGILYTDFYWVAMCIIVPIKLYFAFGKSELKIISKLLTTEEVQVVGRIGTGEISPDKAAIVIAGLFAGKPLRFALVAISYALIYFLTLVIPYSRLFTFGTFPYLVTILALHFGFKGLMIGGYSISKPLSSIIFALMLIAHFYN